MTNESAIKKIPSPPSGILLVNKPKGKTSFSLVARARKLFGVKKIGHTGTLDPFATGVMVLLVGREYTRLSFPLLSKDKDYLARVFLGKATDTYDSEGVETATSDYVPSREEVEKGLLQFQGDVEQVPPMFSAKKQNGKKLYELARKGIVVERKAVTVHIKAELLDYQFPYLDLKVTCSSGTYIRSIAHDLGIALGTCAHLEGLIRTRTGSFALNACIDGVQFFDDPSFEPSPYLLKTCETAEKPV